jgi:hypothetical protein
MNHSENVRSSCPFPAEEVAIQGRLVAQKHHLVAAARQEQ